MIHENLQKVAYRAPLRYELGNCDFKKSYDVPKMQSTQKLPET